jgi:hypothetical protein
MMMGTLSITVTVEWTWLQRKKEDKVSWHETQASMVVVLPLLMFIYYI